MFVLGGGEEIGDTASLARAIERGLGAALIEGSASPRVSIGDGSLTLDLTGCAFRGGPPPGEGAAPAAGGAGFPFAEIRLQGEPVRFGGTETTMRVRVSDADCGVVSSEDGSRVLGFQRVGGGTLDVFVAKEEMERRLRAGLDAKARGQGVRVLDVSLDLQTEGADGAFLTLHITLKMVFRARIRVSGVLRLGSDLTLVVDQAFARGEGMAGKMVAGLVAPQLASLSGKEFPLGRLLPPGLSVTDATLVTEGGLGISGRLGASAGEDG